MVPKKRRVQPAVAATLAVLALCGAPTNSHALTCANRHFTLNEAYAAADSIIVGLITECGEETSSDPWAVGSGDCSFSSIDVLKESTPTRDYSGTTSSSGCGLSLQVGGQYLLFLDSNNQPMRFSTSLGGDRHQARLANSYLRIIRDFRDGVVDHLAEPWMFAESDGYCAIWQSVSGNKIRFNRRATDAPRQPTYEWVSETANGTRVHRTMVPAYGADSKMPVGEVELVAFGDIPDFANKAPMLKIHLQETSPAPLRRATLSVGSRTWSLDRMESTVFHQGVTVGPIVDYYATGDMAEQILSAMVKPFGIVVAATVVPNTMDAASPPEDSPSGQDSFLRAPSTDVHSGQAAPDAGPARAEVTPTVKAAGSYRARGKPPPAVIRVEARSTYLSSVIQRFRACAAGAD